MQDQLQTNQTSEQLTLFSVEELAVKCSFSADLLKLQIKEAKAMVKEQCLESGAYVEQENRVKGEKKQLDSIKAEINDLPNMRPIVQKIKDLTSELKQKKNSVSEFALEVVRLGNKSEIEKDGVTYDIVKSAKLVKRKQ